MYEICRFLHEYSPAIDFQYMKLRSICFFSFFFFFTTSTTLKLMMIHIERVYLESTRIWKRERDTKRRKINSPICPFWVPTLRKKGFKKKKKTLNSHWRGRLENHFNITILHGDSVTLYETNPFLFSFNITVHYHY